MISLTQDERTPLQCAAAQEGDRYLHVVELLVKEGADIFTKDWVSQGRLHSAWILTDMIGFFDSVHGDYPSSRCSSERKHIYDQHPVGQWGRC